ncbi:3-dehydroquinate synthase [Nostoc linckia z18]|uniref:3-dehydroquinate synthase n=2 Tax=Nostoc linckia TaxID=92942 RepID=A0A9Q5Z933_NOSLI|nr:3-dehydroquinate synthase [Nostoc linckia]PHK37150.1 3-dehydroquinate synthase [Nostoc linckia z15]PHK43645.1 3-dehydroquinate synthase [Nostoc linckia z16]PHJ57490.1 3-dehydroquinate synthase [Nostoc linckia z1]PHJ71711.1 3-dehydroquinate synthase [Nostoc linckia z3]PHJ77786.1 3-dehydroquinate synthase [Nostoc linckia z2]
MAIKQKTALNLQPINQYVQVSFKYDVHFTRGLFELDNLLLAQVIAGNEEITPKRVLVVVDEGVLNYQNALLKKIALYGQCYADVITLTGEPIIVPGGEAVKNDSRFIEQIHQRIDAVGLCRHSYVLAIGGGAVLDMAGYAAATAHRGIRLLRVPTTVLGQNDSGVGVKNGINAFGKKNFLGTFMPPYAVLNDFDFITSLDDRDWRSGIAEAVKVALIKDVDFFNFIMTYADRLANRDMEIMEKLIYRCSQLHLEHIAGSGDPFEMGSSRPLDFGHWAAHKLEHLTNYSLRHGEAVAIGIALDTTYSYLTGRLLQSEWQRILVTLKKLGFTLYVSALKEQLDNPDHPNCIFRGLTEFREHLGGKLTITLLEGIGQGIEVNEVDLSFYKDAISLLQDWEILR